MKKFFTRLLILAKRQFKNPMLIILLIAIPLTSLCVKLIPQSDEKKSYLAGIYVDGNDKVSKELSESLCEYSGSFTFVMYDNLDLMYRDVENTTLLCGYIFPDDLTYRTIDEDCRNSITVIKQPSNTLQNSINEIVYSRLIRIQGRYIITGYVDSTGIFAESGVDYINELLTYYNKYLESDITFHMAYETYGVNGLVKSDASIKPVTFPTRGILSVLVFLSGLFGGLLWRQDMEKGVFTTLPVSQRRMCLVLYPLIPATAFGVVCIFAIGLFGITVSAFIEVAAMALLVALSVLFTILLVCLTRKSKNYAAIIPVLLLCCLIFCPVFINTSLYIPAARFVEKLFVPYYYLKFFM